MIKQRKVNSAEVICAKAENLPFADNAFDVALAILSVHHWFDWEDGLREMRRVARDKVVILTWNPTHEGFWLVRDYFPDILDCDRSIFPTIPAFERVLGKIDVQKVPIPHDCLDGFLGAYWRRPSAYLDPEVRSAISTFARIDNVASRRDRLRSDIENGLWARKNADILDIEQLDIGYRLIIHQIEN
ncbi:putative MerR-family transcriptional regulator [Calothrix sp. NIES-4101]|nr:putative MerR-family transcriptional regulator [Calothrix sp. NIES-4101]